MKDEEKELAYWMALAHAEKVWTRRKNEIIVDFYLQGKSIIDMFSADVDDWRNVYKIREDEIPLLLDAKERVPNYSFDAEDLLNQGYDITPITYKGYPEMLKRNLKYNAPILVYSRGNKELLNRRCVAIVGSRKAKEISLGFTANMAKRAVAEGSVVVSGYAKGVDRQALEAAVDNGGSSIIVLPQGISTFSTGFRQLHKYMVEGRLLVMSVYLPKAPWSVALAMARNTLIYAMAEDIYVAESDATGGTFAGATDGIRRGRTIYVRKPEDGEHNANMQLVEMGAKAVDAEGNVIEGVKTGRDTLVDGIHELLKRAPRTAKELAKILLSDDGRKSQDKIRSIIKDMKDVEQMPRKKPVTYTLKGAAPELF